MKNRNYGRYIEDFVCDESYNDEELIIKILSSSLFADIFFQNELDDEEKQKYYLYLKNRFDLIRYLVSKGDKFIADFIKYNNKFKDDVFSQLDLLKNIKDFNIILDLVDFLPNVAFSFFYTTLLEKAPNDGDRIKLIKKVFEKEQYVPLLIEMIKVLEEDKNKIYLLDVLKVADRIDVIKSFADVSLKKEFAMNPEYKSFQAELVVDTKDKDFILDSFDKINDRVFRNSLIKIIDNYELKSELIIRLNDENSKNFFDDINSEWDVDLSDIDFDKINNEITIGVELETCHKSISSFLMFKEVLKDYRITKDASVKSGFEIKSPVLHYDYEDISKLKRVCEILNKNKFYTDDSCGGHIHIGANYLTDISHYKMLLYIFCNCEEIFYYISNREGTGTRFSVYKYAGKIKKKYIRAVREDKLKNESSEFRDFIKLIQDINVSRYKGMNFSNLGGYFNTIEFRIPNGEIMFDELIVNIRLYASLVQKARELLMLSVNDPRHDLLELLKEPIKEKEKLEILLELLFDNDKDREVYRRRYFKNIDGLHEIMFNTFSDKNTLDFDSGKKKRKIFGK